MAYVPPQAQPVKRYPGEMIVPDLINDRIAPFLRAVGSLNPVTAPFVIPMTYGKGMMEAALDAQKRGSRIPGLPEFGLSEAASSFGSQLGDDLKVTLSGSEKKEETESADSAAPKVFDRTLEGQYQRYFQTPEMDYVFGAGARGKDAPKDAAAMEVLGNQLQAPEKDTNIASMYRAQSAMGRVNEDAIQKMYEGDDRMQAWARENPMLAQREYLKAEQRRANEMPLAPDNETVMGDLGSRAQMDNPMGQEAYDRIKKQLLNKASTK